MKPVMLVKPQKPPRVPAGLIRNTRDLSLGEVDSLSVAPDDFPDWVAFIGHLRQCGWRPRACNRYSEYTYTYVNGSCPWHEDPGFGKVAACLLHRYSDLCITTQLITKHGGCDLRLGDLVVFDSDYGHAWIGHGPSVFAMVTVAPIRKTKS